MFHLCQSVHIYLSQAVRADLSLSLSIYLSTVGNSFLSIYLSITANAYLFIYLLIYLSIFKSFYLQIHLWLFIHIHIYQLLRSGRIWLKVNF